MAVVAPVPAITLVQSLIPSVDCCHCKVPVYPARLILVAVPEQREDTNEEAVPPTDEADTTVAVDDVAVGDTQPKV